MVQLSDPELKNSLVTAATLLARLPRSADKLVRRLELIVEILSKVKQSRAKSMQNYLSPIIKALVMDDLLKHTDVDVKVGVASCISEITRIAAPDFPYDENKMKEIFQLFVSSFENLSEVTRRSYVKRAKILKNVAEVRSCLLMLDLECDVMIVEMFQHFLKAIRNCHADDIFKSMETIMTLVLEESEDISPELLAPILATLKRNNEAATPIAKKLAERVLQNSADKLRPYLRQAVKSSNTSFDDYSEVVSCVCGVTPKMSNKRKPTPDLNMKKEKKGNANSETSRKRQKVEGSPKSKPIDTAPKSGSKSKDDDKAEFGGKGHVDIGEASSGSKDEIAEILLHLSSGAPRVTRSSLSKLREIHLEKEKTDEYEDVSKNDDARANDQTEKTVDASNKTEHRYSLRKHDGKKKEHAEPKDDEKKKGRAKPTSEKDVRKSSASEDQTKKTVDDASNKTENSSSLRKDDGRKKGRAKPHDDEKKKGRAKPTSEKDVRKSSASEDQTEKTVDDARNKTENSSSLRKDNGKKKGRAKPHDDEKKKGRAKSTSEKDVRKSSASEDLGKISGEASLNEDIHLLPQVMENMNSDTSEAAITAAMEILNNAPGIAPGGELWNYACNLITQNNSRVVFLRLPSHETRLSWLKFNYDLYKKSK